MDARYIMDYTAFELMYEGIRHTTVEKHAKEWGLTGEQIETLKERLLEEENRVYEYWLSALPHFAVFESGSLDYDWDADTDTRLGADALTTIARDLIERVGSAEQMLAEGVFPALADYTEELEILIRDFDERAYSYDKVKRVETGVDGAAEDSLFSAGWRPSLSQVGDLFNTAPMSLDELHDLMGGLRAEYIDWIEERIADMDDAIDELDEDAEDYDDRREALVNACVDDIADDMIDEGWMGKPYYIHEVEDLLSTCHNLDIYTPVLRRLRKRAGVDEE
nr:MAG TPA: hypothetical protein [Caudoviricetes sp.]